MKKVNCTLRYAKRVVVKIHPRIFSEIISILLERELLIRAARDYITITSPRFKILYRIFSLKDLIIFAGKMAEDLGWYQTLKVYRENSEILSEVLNIFLDDLSEYAFIFLLVISSGILEKMTGYYVKEVEKIGKGLYRLHICKTTNEKENIVSLRLLSRYLSKEISQG